MRMLPLTASIRIPWASGAVAPTLQSGYALQDGLPATSVCAEAVNAQVAAPVKAHVCVKYEIQAGRRSRLWQRGGCPIYLAFSRWYQILLTSRPGHPRSLRARTATPYIYPANKHAYKNLGVLTL